ncbi:hypothetical protein SDC9_204869 [bioreactor metagenome]|uniref:Uncharacterized protein n=1 Tax=bioreactor metagenome TaxID=1076179 RepID=A0A645J0F3_9ZZZZ
MARNGFADTPELPLFPVPEPDHPDADVAVERDFFLGERFVTLEAAEETFFSGIRNKLRRHSKPDRGKADRFAVTDQRRRKRVNSDRQILPFPDGVGFQ